MRVKGGDDDMDKLAEMAVVKACGGRALAIPLVEGYPAMGQKIFGDSAAG